MKTKKTEIPVYLFAGFLEAGKTQFINSILADGFAKEERTLLIRCEEGELDYDPAVLDNVVVVTLEDQEEATRAFFDELDQKYRPEQILIEWNGMWPMQALIEEDLPDHWLVYQVMTIIDAATFEVYVKNMGQIMMEKVINADMLVFNRATPELAAQLRARNLRMVNRRADMYIEYTDEHVEEYANDDTPPFDMKGGKLELTDDDYGVWFVDVMDNPERYDGVEMTLKMVMCHSKQFPGVCCPGRFAMVCCEEDVQFLGLIAEGQGLTDFENHEWVKITGRMSVENREPYHGPGPVLNVLSIEPADPADPEIVSF